MTLTKTLRALSATMLAGGLLLTSATGASADQVRDGQWPNQAFNLDKVWSVSKGDGVIVAVIDSGVDAGHPDLAGNVLPGSDPSGKGLNTRPTDPHGTKMAALIAAHGHGDGAGVVGLAPGAKILPIYKANDHDGDAVPQGIRWAVDHSAKVINLSLAGLIGDDELTEAIAYAAQHDVLIVAGAGNDGSAVASPAKEPGVLAVGGVDKTNTIWKGSNFGPEVLLSAPAVDIVSAGSCDGRQYCISTGTSDATAYVSGAAALIRAKYPKLTAGQVANRLVKSALVPSSLKGAKLPDEHYGYGIIRPYEALTQNIPAGSAQGPLGKPAGSGSGDTQSSGATAPSTTGPDATDPAAVPPLAVDDSDGTIATVFYALGFGLVILAALVAVIVVVSRRRRAPAAGQPGPAPYGTPPGAWPPAQPPYPNQPQPPYGNQAPPPGYPPQQPYQNPYSQDGNQPR